MLMKLGARSYLKQSIESDRAVNERLREMARKLTAAKIPFIMCRDEFVVETLEGE